MTARDLLHPRDEIMQTMERIYRCRMTTTSGGNLSIRDGADVWITPARVDKGSLRREDIVCVRGDGTVDGPHRPSSEFPFHESIYAARPDLGGVVHAHPVALVAFSISGQRPDPRLFPQAHHVCGQVGFAPYALPGSRQLAENIAAVFAAGFDCVVLENHGVVVGGTTLAHAFRRFETLEFTARTTIGARALGAVRLLSADDLHPSLRPTPALAPLAPAAASSREKELRRQLRDFVRRGCRQRLLISTEGSFSARLDEDAFLVTPSQQDRELLDIDDFVLVRGDAAETPHGLPSRATFAHRALYRRHPEIQAIVFAHPICATAFSVTGAAFDARTIPESYLLLRDVSRVPFGLPFRDPAALAELVTPRRPVAILENDGVLVAGTSVLDAFDRLEVLESTAEAILSAGSLGPVRTMPEAVIEELDRAFGL